MEILWTFFFLLSKMKGNNTKTVFFHQPRTLLQLADVAYNNRRCPELSCTHCTAIQFSAVQWGWRPYYPRLGEWSAYSNFFHKSGNSKIFLSHLLQYSNSSSPYMLVLHCSSSLQSQRFSVENPNSLMIRHSINCPLCWVSQKLKIQGDYILSSEHSAHRG